MNHQNERKDVYEAISDENRRKLLRILAEADELPLYRLTVHFEIGRTAVSKHLAILREADLVTSRKVGRETRYRLNAEPLQEVQNWVSFYEDFWRERMNKLSIILEEKRMKPDVSLDFKFNSSIEEVWKALTDSEMLSKWIWENNFKADVGYTFQFKSEPNKWWDGIVNGEVLEVDKPFKLVYTWDSAGEKTTITWTLNESANGTELHFEQTGFSEQTKATKGAIEGATYSWMKFGEKLERLLQK